MFPVFCVVKSDYSVLTVSDEVCKEEQVNGDGDGGSGECAAKSVDEKIRHQMYALTF